MKKKSKGKDKKKKILVSKKSLHAGKRMKKGPGKRLGKAPAKPMMDTRKMEEMFGDEPV